MRKRAALICILTGAVLVISALLLFTYNQSESLHADEVSQKAVNALEEYIDDNSANELDSAMIDGYEYIGYIQIPDIDRKLPVLSQCDQQRLLFAPCQDTGAVAENTLVIAAHNYDAHFGRLYQLSLGSKTYFTALDGTTTEYSLVELTTLQPEETDRVYSSTHDLVLYTCTYGGKSRVVAFFDEI